MTPNKVSILFVCSGNACRSPMAEGMAREICRKRGIDAEISSAGTLGIDGESATANAVRVCAEIGVDISGHRSHALSRERIERFDKVFGMENAHIQEVRRLAPDFSGELSLLCPGGEIEDPVMQNMDFYRTTRNRIAECLEEFFDREFS